MQKIIEKFVVSNIAPANKNVGWIKLDASGNSTIYIYMENKGGWTSAGSAGISEQELIETINTPV